MRGRKMSRGQDLWTKAKTLIPGGGMLLSKRAEMFLPDIWPAYFSRASGCEVWDLSGHHYYDFSLMGVGTNVLGYCHDEVDRAVKSAIEKGNMSTLNCPEEVQLAESLVDLHPWSDMVRFARSGGEANAIAVRIARAASGKDGVAVCGYHGWHDWYLSVNMNGADALTDHLLPGLSTAGVPRGLKNTTFSFKYNDFEALQEIVATQSIGVIKMEVCRSELPRDNFLKKVRDLASKQNIVLIFDECTSGFRETMGGLHKKFNVEPDIAIFGKALGNGYAITAVLGRKQIMEVAQNSFISSTFWTERIGPVAGNATLRVMGESESWRTITGRGIEIKEGWREMAEKFSLPIAVFGIDPLPSFAFESKRALHYKTLITQEMLKKGYLATTSIYVSLAHTNELLAKYFTDLEEVFSLISYIEHNQLDVDSYLDGPVCHSGFQRLN